MSKESAMNLDPRQDDPIIRELLSKIDALQNHAATTHAIQDLVVETSKQSVILEMIQKSLEKAEESFIAGSKAMNQRFEQIEKDRIRPLEEFKSNLEGQMMKAGMQGGAVGASGVGFLVGLYHLFKDYFHVVVPSAK
jgi:hypothetical protein